MTLLRIIGAFLLFIFLGIVGFFAIVGKILGTLLAPPKPPAPSSATKRGEPVKKSANDEVIEVEVISVRKDDF
ncbi:MAG: hypothetical protein LBK60_10670 [Verrucomicrobiales bacterium]|jgi:hypothetical protein|nr:hypothetical protein [Verrucomicrobiales bacterium]